jgi:hypothetical protein
MMAEKTYYLATTGGDYSIVLTIDDTVVYGVYTADRFASTYDLDGSQDIILSCGIQSEYTNGEYGYFLPSETTIQFAVNGYDNYAMRYFRDAVTSVVINGPTSVVFQGKLDRQSVQYSFDTMTLTAVFSPYIRPNRAIKASDGTIDTELFLEIFGVNYAQSYNANTVGDWINLRSAIHTLLYWFGAKDGIIDGDFGRYMSSVVLQERGVSIGQTSTSGAAGWDNSITLYQWADANYNFVFNRIYIYKRILCQEGKYETVGASTALDIIINLCREIGAVIGISPDGLGFVYPAYMDRNPTILDSEEIMSVSASGCLEKTSALVVAGGLYPLDSYASNSPGMSFVPGVSAFGTVRYNSAGLHNNQFYSVATIFTEALDLGSEVKIFKFMHNPLQGHIPDAEGADGFGFQNSATLTPDSSLKAVKYVGTEDYWRSSGNNYWLSKDVSSIVSMGCWYYSLYKADREQISIDLNGTDYLIYETYLLPSKYGSVSIRPLKIEVNITQQTTTMTGLSVTENTLLFPSGSGTGSGGVVGLPIVIDVITALLTIQPGDHVLSTCHKDLVGHIVELTGWANAQWTFIIDSPGVWSVWVEVESFAGAMPYTQQIYGLGLTVDGDARNILSVQSPSVTGPYHGGYIWRLALSKTLGIW